MSDRPSLAIKRYPIELAQDADTVVRLDRTRLLLGFREPQARDALVPRLLDLDLDLEPSGAATDGGPQSELVNHTDRRFWVRTSLGSAIDGELHHRIGAAFDEQLEWIGPVYHDPHVPGRASLHCPLPNALILDPPSGFVTGGVS